ncbi:MAG: ABC transporter ATP-binding protein [Rhodospirillales bacterium]|nr:ABC transporter ATP-binding protein [Rhodospirillales bacterium]
MPARTDHERERVRVGVRRVFGEEGRRRPEDFEVKRSRAQRRPGGDLFRAGAVGPSRGDEPAVEAPVGEPGDRQPPERFRDPGRVVGLIVGDDRGAEARHALAVELGDEFVARRAPVDEDRRRVPGLQEDRVAQARCDELLELLDLRAVAQRPAGTLPFGFQKRIELARALIGNPKLLLLDEPAAGLNHSEVDELARLIQQVRDHFNLSVLLVEHHMSLVMRVSDKVVALEFGMKIADGTPEEVRNEPEVIRAYLGDTQESSHVGAA